MNILRSSLIYNLKFGKKIDRGGTNDFTIELLEI